MSEDATATADVQGEERVWVDWNVWSCCDLWLLRRVVVVG